MMDSIVLESLAVTRGKILYGTFKDIDHKKFFVIIGDGNYKYYDVKCSQYSRNVSSRNSSVNVIFKICEAAIEKKKY